MSKGKFKRQRQRALHQSEEVQRLNAAAAVTAKHQKKGADGTGSDAEQKDKRPMGFREFAKSKHFTDICLTIFTCALAGVAVFQAVITNNQLTVMRNDQRAWLEVKPQDGMVIHVVYGQLVKYPIQLANVGKTPARNIHMETFVEIPNASQEARLECVDMGGSCPHRGLRAGIIFPNTHLDFMAFRIEDNTQPLVVTQPEADAWENGRAYASVYGIVSYDDIFNHHHWTKFCYWTPPDNKGQIFQVKNCGEYNNVDNNN
jgi:hypothetical protein